MLRFPRRVGVAVLCLLTASFARTLVFGETELPPSIPPQPVLSVSKNVGTGEVLLSWTSTASPYAAVRGTNPDFFGAVSPQITASGLVGTSFSEAVLNDGINYFYTLEDANTSTKVYSMSALAGLPGDSITLAGLGFDTSAPSANEVFVTGEQAVVTGVTPTSLTFTIPAAALSGSVVASSNKGVDGGRTILTVATGGLFNASSVAVDAAHIPFVADLGTGATSDKVFSFDPATGTRTQVGAVAEPIGLGSDSATPNFIYYGDATASTANFGVIRRTNSNGADGAFGSCGDSTTVPQQNCWVWGVGVDPDLTDYGPQGRIYVADRNHNEVKIVRPVGSIGLPFFTFAAPGQFLSSPRGIIVDRNGNSPFYHDVFVSMSNAVKRYSPAVPGVLETTYDSSNSPISNPGQMAITPSGAPNAAGERLLVADRGQNRVIMINPATDKSKSISIPLDTPRGIAVDRDALGKTFAYVAEPTRVVKFPVYKTVFVVPWIAEGAGIGPERIRLQVERARRSLEKCGIEVRIRDDKVNYFAPAGLLDLEITDWTSTASSCTNPTLTRTGEETALLEGRRSTDPTDLNIYFVRSFTGPSALLTIAETITQDCFSDVADGSKSGIIVSVAQLNAVASETIRTLAHEIGHALLDRLSWSGGDEHKNSSGFFYVAPNLMAVNAGKYMRFLEDPAQCVNINQDLPTQIFRGDP